MSLLDDNIIEETSLFSGVPNKDDYIYESRLLVIGKIHHFLETFYYDYPCPYFKTKYYMPFGLRIAARTIFTDNYKTSKFLLKLEAIDSNNINMRLRTVCLDQTLGILPYAYKNDIPNILYDFLEIIKNDPLRFIDIIESNVLSSAQYSALRYFFKIDINYNFIKDY